MTERGMCRRAVPCPPCERIADQRQMKSVFWGLTLFVPSASVGGAAFQPQGNAAADRLHSNLVSRHTSPTAEVWKGCERGLGVQAPHPSQCVRPVGAHASRPLPLPLPARNAGAPPFATRRHSHGISRKTHAIPHISTMLSHMKTLPHPGSPGRLSPTTTPSPSPAVFCPSRPSELPGKELVISSARSRVGRRVPSPPEAGTCLRISVDVRMAIRSETRENLPARISSAFPRHDGLRRAGTARPTPVARFSLRALHAKTGAFRLPFRCPEGRFPLPALRRRAASGRSGGR